MKWILKIMNISQTKVQNQFKNLIYPREANFPVHSKQVNSSQHSPLQKNIQEELEIEISTEHFFTFGQSEAEAWRFSTLLLSLQTSQIHLNSPSLSQRQKASQQLGFYIYILSISEPQQQTDEELFYIGRKTWMIKDISRWIRPLPFPAALTWVCEASLDKGSYCSNTPEGTFVKQK